ncbi:MAG: YjzC family protein [Pseudomonadota bacterium]|nr:YjzC family protein [Pseudomonadota bacterium]
MASSYKPGEKAPHSGEYGINGPRGGDTGKERTVVRGEPLPPTPKAGQTYTLNRPAHNGAGRGGKK